MFKDATELDRTERDQNADSVRTHAAIDAAENAIAALAARQLDPDETRKEWSAIRDRTILAIRNVRQSGANRALRRSGYRKNAAIRSKGLTTGSEWAASVSN